jgi:hypothetical protein
MMHPATAQLIQTMLAMQEQCIAAVRGAITADQYNGPAPVTAAERAKELAKSGAEPQFCSTEEESLLDKQMKNIFENYQSEDVKPELENEPIMGYIKPF